MRLPTFTPAARQRAEAAQASRAPSGLADSWSDRSLWDRCITVGLPFVMLPTGYNNNVRIIQSPGYVVITHEMIRDARVVPTNGGQHLSPAIRQYIGDSRGRRGGIFEYARHEGNRGLANILNAARAEERR